MEKLKVNWSVTRVDNCSRFLQSKIFRQIHRKIAYLALICASQVNSPKTPHKLNKYLPSFLVKLKGTLKCMSCSIYLLTANFLDLFVKWQDCFHCFSIIFSEGLGLEYRNGFRLFGCEIFGLMRELYRAHLSLSTLAYIHFETETRRPTERWLSFNKIQAKSSQNEFEECM